MTEKQARRPPVAPKPSFIHQDASTQKIAPAPSPALRGASSAFGPTPVKASSSTTTSHNPSAGALLAATLAASKKQQQQQSLRQHGPPSLASPPAPRGRQLTPAPAPVASSNASSASPPKPGFQPHQPRSTSAVAAVAASATASTGTSPVRRPEITRHRSSQYIGTPEPNQEVRHRGMSTSSNRELAKVPQRRSADAVAGAVASMAAAPTQVHGANDEKKRNELVYNSYLTLQSSQPSSTSSPSPSGTAAAAVATRNAASADAKKRTGSSPREGSQTKQPSSSAILSPAPTLGSSWPRFRVTPPQTDSESETTRTWAEPPPKSSTQSLVAPVPVRPTRAAVVAQEHANGLSTNPPVLDSRTKMTASSLADAIVASSIASQHTSSRVASPSAKPPPPMPRRRSKSVGIFRDAKHNMHIPGFRTETPLQSPKLQPRTVRPMRQTMRNPSPEHEEVADENIKRGRRHWRRHPNMHHEGDRKRWRDKITERERKRYEGVWAANRGLLLDFEHDNTDRREFNKDGTPISDLVVNVVVRDIWERSRLPRDVLEEIWDLVSPPGAKTLDRGEFVVGLWLIDQRLKGRKLPVKVSSSVWSSVRHIQGVKLSSRPLQK